ncbi:Molybdopterin molybdenumtransferase [hydrothermal vent metagenome]|uniref:molybdopterin molybdotransferase n=1 Tax=hydrothermal vent metagenome TaxID=652676 RepID=A0A3B0YCP0_9ZZZZ
MDTSISIDYCADGADKLLSFEQGRQRILDDVNVIDAGEQLPIRSALNRVLAQPVVAAIDVPPFINSAMDGYALHSTDVQVGQSNSFKIIGTCFAGAPFTGTVRQGECVRIMTGAVMPEGADAVVMQEHTRHEGNFITLNYDTLQTGTNVRYAGEDSRRGDTVLEPGIRIGPAEIGLLASVGIGEIQVQRKLRATFFSTGDELTSVGSPLQAGQIYDSNRYILFAALENAGVECHDLGVIADDREAVRTAFKQAADTADLVITSGGVSVGEADFVTSTLEELGEVSLWRMAIKPGKPLAFGRLGQACFFGLPGNPVSVMATFYQFVLPAIHKMNGLNQRPPLLIRVGAGEDFKKAPGRMEFQRGILLQDEHGHWSVCSTGSQGSHLLTSMSKANCFILLDAESTGVEQGSPVTVQPFSDLV